VRLRRGAALALVVMLGGCRLETRRTVDSADHARVVADAATHPCGPPVIDSAGVGALRIGVPLDSVRARCLVLRDTVELRAEGQPARIVSVPIGGDTVEAEIVDGRVWRVTVARPGLRTADSLGVGTPVTRLLALFPRAIGAHGEGGIYATSTRCGLSFRLTDLAPGARFRGGTTAALRALPPGAAVTRVLVTGCSPRGT
jgi:hypothetical protein